MDGSAIPMEVKSRIVKQLTLFDKRGKFVSFNDAAI
jgi:hypothetical protein